VADNPKLAKILHLLGELNDAQASLGKVLVPEQIDFLVLYSLNEALDLCQRCSKKGSSALLVKQGDAS
jgi:hypothetical protein